MLLAVQKGCFKAGNYSSYLIQKKGKNEDKIIASIKTNK